MDDRKYRFDWALIGDASTGRPHLGPDVPLEAYRLMQYCFRDVLERQYGTQMADELFREAGRVAGAEYARHVIGEQPDLPSFVSALQTSLRDSRIGILRMEEVSDDGSHVVLTVSEDLDCSGLPELGYGVCTFDEGFIAAVLESHIGKPFEAREVDCWCTGDRTCRFEANVVL
jgi:predicted hydrocarbon binding protein